MLRQETVCVVYTTKAYGRIIPSLDLSGRLPIVGKRLAQVKHLESRASTAERLM